MASLSDKFKRRKARDSAGLRNTEQVGFPEQPGSSEEIERGSPSDVLRALLRKSTPPRTSDPLVLNFPLSKVENVSGQAFCLRRTLAADAAYGRALISSARRLSSQGLAALTGDEQLKDIAFRDALFLDTETTGLRGAGTIAFVVGLLYFDDGDDGVPMVEQWLLTSPIEEAAMLTGVAERVARAKYLVTYNGKSFDWPLLRARFMINRVSAPPLPAHLDLLPAARRLFRKRLDRVRLVDLESHILGHERKDDVPGALAPRAFMDFVDGKSSKLYEAIIEHNYFDLLAMTGLVATIIPQIDELVDMDDPWDAVSFAKVAERAKDHGRALRFARRGERGEADCRTESKLLQARVARRQKDIAGEEQHLLDALASSQDEIQAATAHLALSKLYEHKKKDYVLALKHALFCEDVEGELVNDKRIARIERKSIAGRG